MPADGQERSRRKPIVTAVQRGAAGAECEVPGSPVLAGSTAKPTPAGLGVDLATLDWQRSGAGSGAFEVAFVADRHDAAGEATPDTARDRVDWVLLRVADDPAGRVLVYDRNEWMCFLDGASRGEFDRPDGLTRAPAA
jgi:hypothetical protein